MCSCRPLKGPLVAPAGGSLEHAVFQEVLGGLRKASSREIARRGCENARPGVDRPSGGAGVRERSEAYRDIDPAIAPGSTETEGTRAAGLSGSDFEKMLIARTPLGRNGRPEDIAPVAVFLAGEDSAWLTGERISASGGVAEHHRHRRPSQEASLGPLVQRRPGAGWQAPGRRLSAGGPFTTCRMSPTSLLDKREGRGAPGRN